MFSMLLRDFSHSGLQRGEDTRYTAVLRQISETQRPPVSNFLGALAPPKVLRCLPTGRFDVSMMSEQQVALVQLLPRVWQSAKDDFLDPNEFWAVIRNSSHFSLCRGVLSKLKDMTVQAALFVNPLMRDRVLFELSVSEHLSSAPSSYPYLTQEGREAIANSCKYTDPRFPSRVFDIFSAFSPFVAMQQFVLYLEAELKARTNGVGSILGEFEPVTQKERFPIPIFRRNSDGCLGAFLWHGTAAHNAQSIGTSSFLSKCSLRQLYSAGTYFAVQACKSLQYTGTGGKSCLLLNFVN